MEEDIQKLAWYGRGEVEWPIQLLPHSNPRKGESGLKDSRRMSLVPREGRYDSTKNPLKILANCIMHSFDGKVHIFDHILKMWMAMTKDWIGKTEL